MPTLTDTIVANGLRATLTAVRRVRKRVQFIVRQNREKSPTELIMLIRRELEKTEPIIARVLERATLAAWIAGARGPAREALFRQPEEYQKQRSLEETFHLPPSPPFGPLNRIASGDDPGRPLRFPALEAAARDLERRSAMTIDQYDRLSEEARHTGFTVARNLTEDATETVREAVQKHIVQGGDLRTFRNDIGAVMRSGGLTEPQVETTYRTQTLLARASGVRSVLNHPLVRGEMPYCQYFCIHDGRTRVQHKQLEHLGIKGTNIYRVDDPFIQRVWPPWEWNCRCTVVLLSLEDAASKGIREAMMWLRTGEPPLEPAFVPDPGFQRPRGFPACTGGIHPIVI